MFAGWLSIAAIRNVCISPACRPLPKAAPWCPCAFFCQLERGICVSSARSWSLNKTSVRSSAFGERATDGVAVGKLGEHAVAVIRARRSWQLVALCLLRIESLRNVRVSGPFYASNSQATRDRLMETCRESVPNSPPTTCGVFLLF